MKIGLHDAHRLAGKKENSATTGSWGHVIRATVEICSKSYSDVDKGIPTLWGMRKG